MAIERQHVLVQQQERSFHEEHLVDVVDDGATGDLTDDTREVDGADVECRGVEGDVVVLGEMVGQQTNEADEDFLEALNEKYRNRGLVCIGFPCNQFAHQDPGSDSEIQEFCQVNYGVTFQIMKKVDVNGADEHPIFTYLKEQAPDEEYKGLKAKAAATMFKSISKSVEKDSDIKWNFTKSLISRDGSVVKRFAPTTEPKDFEKEIEAML